MRGSRGACVGSRAGGRAPGTASCSRREVRDCSSALWTRLFPAGGMGRGRQRADSRRSPVGRLGPKRGWRAGVARSGRGTASGCGECIRVDGGWQEGAQGSARTRRDDAFPSPSGVCVGFWSPDDVRCCLRVRTPRVGAVAREAVPVDFAVAEMLRFPRWNVCFLFACFLLWRSQVCCCLVRSSWEELCFVCAGVSRHCGGPGGARAVVDRRCFGGTRTLACV